MLTILSGDPLLTHAQTLAFGTNARGRGETEALHTSLAYRYPAAFAAYGKQARAGRVKPGQFWIWRESRPNRLFMAVRDTPFSITRVRYVETVALTLARDYQLHTVDSLAIAPLGLPHEWPILPSPCPSFSTTATFQDSNPTNLSNPHKQKERGISRAPLYRCVESLLYSIPPHRLLPPACSQFIRVGLCARFC
jgi:hypothetical protein